MTNDDAIRILSSETSLEAVRELREKTSDDKEKVVEIIQKAMDMGAEALKSTDDSEKDRMINGLVKLLDTYDNDWICDALTKAGYDCENACGEKGDSMKLCYFEYIRRCGIDT